MSVATTYRQAFDPVPGHATRFTELVRSLTPAEVEAAVPDGSWTAGDVARHVLSVLRRYGESDERAATRQGLDELNERELRAVDLPVAEVADAIDAEVDRIAGIAPLLSDDSRLEFHLGLRVDPPAAWANLCSELLVHGWDIARATGRPWPFPAEDVEGIWRNLFPAASAWMRAEAREVDEVYELRFPFGDVTLWLHEGAVSVDDATRPPDHVVEVDDPVTFTLGVPWQRALVTDPAAALLLSRFHDI